MIAEAIEGKVLDMNGQPLTIIDKLKLKDQEDFDKAKKAGLAAAEKQKAIDEALQVEYNKALTEFIADDTCLTDYASCEPQNREVLVKIFKFVASDELKENKALGTTKMFLPKGLKGGYELGSTAVKDKFYPVVKIIKVGENAGKQDGKNIVQGQTWTVPVMDVDGDDWNPEFLHYMNTFAKAEGSKQGLVHVPGDMLQKLPRIEIYWDKYIYHNPRLLKHDEENLVYLIPDIKLKTQFK